MPAAAQNVHVEGDVHGVWDADTVFVTGDIFLPPGESLYVHPGVYVEFQGFFGFYVQGDLLEVDGTPGHPVVFSVSDTTGLHDVYRPFGAWKGMFIFGVHNDAPSAAGQDHRQRPAGRDPVNPSVQIRHSRMEYAKAPMSENIQDGGALYISGQGSYTFHHVHFFMNYAYMKGGGAFYRHAAPDFYRCTFELNNAGHPPVPEETYGYGGGLYAKHGQGTIRNNRFVQNWASGMGGGLSIDSCDVSIQNNRLYSNDAPLGGGMGLLRSELTPPNSISGNLIAGNHSEFFGGGVAMLAFGGTMLNNTIVGNHAAMGGGLYCNEGAMPGIYNTVLWGNTAASSVQDSQMFIWDVVSDPGFYYCNVQYGTSGFGGAGFDGDFIGCLEADPLFTGEGEHPYQLQEGSPLIVSGDPGVDISLLPDTDLLDNPRIANGRIDIGAYEYQQELPGAFDVGFVITCNEGYPVEGAIVALGDQTNVPGDYLFQDVAPGTHHYIVTKTCFATAEGDVFVHNGDVTEEVALAGLPGDANGDGSVDVTDVLLIVHYYAGYDIVEPFCSDNADANNDGSINVLDCIVTIAMIMAP